MESETSCVVLAGPAASGKRTLVQGIFELNTNNQHATVEYTSKVVGGKSVQTVNLPLRTKYYKADVEIRILPSDEFGAPSECTSAAMKGADALIVLLDATKPESFNAVTAWAEVADSFSPPTMLLVTNKLDIVTGSVPGTDVGIADTRSISAASSGKDLASELLSTINEWCIDHGFEHVECAANSPWAGAELREKSSVPRVYEALQSTMWSHTLEQGKDARSVGQSESKLDLAALPSTSAVAENVFTGDKIGTDANVLRELEKAEAEIVDDELEDVERMDKEVTRLMEQMRAVQQNARSGNLSDEARREAAAQMAMALMKLVEGMDDEEEPDA